MCKAPSRKRTYKVNWNVTVNSVGGRTYWYKNHGADYEGYVIAAKSVTKMSNLELVVAEALAALIYKREIIEIIFYLRTVNEQIYHLICGIHM